MNRLLALSALILATACGVPHVEGACEGVGRCADDSTALFCVGGELEEIPCNGPAGCVANSEELSCDTSRNIAGDRCAPGQEGLAQCSASNANERVICRDGRFMAEACPGGCTTSDGQVFCATE